MSSAAEEPIIPNGTVVPPAMLTVSTAAQMRSLGRLLATQLRAGDLVILSGGLGSGKTTLTQGIGDGLGVRGPITSPTFVIARVHPPVAGSGAAESKRFAGPRPPLVHVDAYRLGSALELDDLDLDTDTASSVTVVEWGEGLAEDLSADRLEITIDAVSPAGGPPPRAPRHEGASPPHIPSTGGTAETAAPPRVGEDDEQQDEEQDVPRTVRISAVGDRWEGVKLPLADLAHRL